jgi:LEA14-like dessication related protein
MKRTPDRVAALAGLSIVLAAITVALAGCRMMGNIQNPSYTIRDIRPHVSIALPLSSSTIDLDFTVSVDNPNSVSLDLAHMDFGVFVNGDRLIDSVSSEHIHVPAHGVNDVHLRVRVGYEQIPKLFQQIVDLIHGHRAHYEIQGDAYFNTPLGQRRYPVEIQATR